jgi:hypothetical protein
MMTWLVPDYDRPRALQMLPALLVGGAISLAGLLPGLQLTSGIDAATVKAANEI